MMNIDDIYNISKQIWHVKYLVLISLKNKNHISVEVLAEFSGPPLSWRSFL